MSPISRSADYTFTRPHRMWSEGGGMLPIQTVILYEMIRYCISPSVFQLKSLRGQTKHGKQFFSRFFLLSNIVLLLHTQRECY